MTNDEREISSHDKRKCPHSGCLLHGDITELSFEGTSYIVCGPD